MHVVLLELAIDPICALVFEGEPSDQTAMHSPPRPRHEPLFGARQLATAFAQGFGVLIGVFGLYAILLPHAPDPEARGGALIALVLANLVLALADAMADDGQLFAPHRRVFWSIAGVLLVLLGAVFAVPSLASIFRVTAPHFSIIMASVVVALVTGAWLRAGQAVLARLRPASAANTSDPRSAANRRSA